MGWFGCCRWNAQAKLGEVWEQSGVSLGGKGPLHVLQRPLEGVGTGAIEAVVYVLWQQGDQEQTEAARKACDDTAS
jgi:hypothetical protein